MLVTGSISVFVVAILIPRQLKVLKQIYQRVGNLTNQSAEAASRVNQVVQSSLDRVRAILENWQNHANESKASSSEQSNAFAELLEENLQEAENLIQRIQTLREVFEEIQKSAKNRCLGSMEGSSFSWFSISLARS